MPNLTCYIIIAQADILDEDAFEARMQLEFETAWADMWRVYREGPIPENYIREDEGGFERPLFNNE